MADNLVAIAEPASADLGETVTNGQPKRPQTLGQRIGQARRLYGVTNVTDYRAEDLARDIGVEASTVSRWERDERVPRPDALAAVAATLGVTVAWLHYGVEPMLAEPATPAHPPAKEGRGQPAPDRRGKDQRKRGNG